LGFEGSVLLAIPATSHPTQGVHLTHVLHHQRWQHPVGQGSFHSALIETGKSTPFRYVYDCGATPKGRLAEQTRVFRQTLRDERQLDLLFVSHLHEDHVNGLVHLLSEPSPIVLTQVILPYLTPLERLLLAWMERPHGAKANDWYISLLSNPVAWFTARGAKRVTVVTRAANDDRDGLVAPPDGQFPDPEGVDPIEIELPPAPNSTRIVAGDPTAGGASEFDHKSPVVLRSGATSFWLFVTYVDPTALKLPELTAALAGRLGISEMELAKRVGDPARLAELVTGNGYRKKVAASYKHACQANINITSMSLFSGPLPVGNDNQWTRLRYLFDLKPADLDGWPWYRQEPHVAWLATGDAPLGSGTPEKAKALGAHLRWGQRSLLNEIATLVLPHHGSRADYPHDLLVATQPELALVSSGHHSKYNHPHPSVTESVLRAGRALAAITETWNDGVREVVHVSQR
jgi:hypothetical protein